MSKQYISSSYFLRYIMIPTNYHMKVYFAERLVANQHGFEEGRLFVTSVESNKFALVNNKISDKLTKNIWIGDTGASCHMKMNMDGIYNMGPRSGGIKVGNENVLKILKIGKFCGKVKQKCGATKFIVLNNIHFVLDMYCNFFKITSAMDAGFHLSGSKNSSLTLRRNATTIILTNFYKVEVVN